MYKEFSAGFVIFISIYDDSKYFYRYLRIPRIFPEILLLLKVQKQSNSAIPGLKLSNKVDKSHVMPPYVLGVTPRDGRW